jgi:CBS domain-containing protein
MSTCSDLMTKNPIWCVSTDSVSNAAQLMKHEEVGLLPVVEDQESKKLIGVVTDHDLVVKVVAEGRRPESTVIADVMTRNPVTCHADDSLERGLSNMAQHQIRRVPIVDDYGALVGIIAQADVALHVDDPTTISEVVRKISRPTPVHRAWPSRNRQESGTTTMRSASHVFPMKLCTRSRAMKTAITTCLLTAVLVAFEESAAQQSIPVAFTNVSVVPMDAHTVLRDHNVIVTNDRITAMGPAASTPVPEGAVRIDGRGKYLMPGLAEMHGHVPPPTAATDSTTDVLFLYVANGVTTVRGMQGAPGQLELRAAAKRGDMIAPNLYLAGPAFNGNSVRTPEEAGAKVRQQKAEGWDLLKVMGGLSVEAYDAMAMTAKGVGIPFGGHVPSAVGVTHALEMGQHTFDHIDGYAEHLNGVTQPIGGAALHDLVARTKKAGAWIVPTLVVWETLRGPVTLHSRTKLPELRYMPRATVEQWTKSLENRLNSPQFKAPEAKQYIDNRMRILWELHAAGVAILLGSDAPQQFNVPGFSIHREMQRITDVGMTTYDIIKSGTASVGYHFKSQDDFGTVTFGKRADLILVDANPLQELSNMQRQSGVMVRGRWLPQSEIQARLDQIAHRHVTSENVVDAPAVPPRLARVKERGT